MGGRKKPDLSAENIPRLKAFAEKYGMDFYWKNEEQGHAVIVNGEAEAYIWVQRMVTQVRKRNGVELSRPLYERPPNYNFSGKMLQRLLLLGNSYTHTTKHGIKVTRKKVSK